MVKRILYVSFSTDLTGAPVSFFNLITNLSNKYIPIICTREKGPLYNRYKKLGIKCYLIAGKNLDDTLHKFVKIIRKEKIDLVHVNCALKYSAYPALAGKLENIPVLWHVREDPKDEIYAKQKFYINYLSDKIIGVSDEIKNNYDKKKSLYIPNGVNISSFQKRDKDKILLKKYNIKNNDFVFGLVGSICKRKNNLLFIESAKKVIKKNKNIKIFLTGLVCDQKYFQKIENFIKRNRLEKNIIITGKIDNIQRIYSIIDVLVLPSSWEGFPRVVIEAMAMGKPVIASNVGNVSKIINSSNGIILKRITAKNIMKAMHYFLGLSNKELTKMGNSARKSVIGKYDILSHVKRIQKVYEELLLDKIHE